MSKPVDSIIVHHSASRWGCARVIDEWHRERGWRMIGYHAVIGNGRPFHGGTYLLPYDGMVEVGRPHNLDALIESDEQGAHAAALGLNARSLGVCCIGGQPDDFTPRQLRALVDWLRAVHGALHHHHGLEPRILGHKEVDGRKPDCPALHMERLRELVTGGLDHRVFSDGELLQHLEP